MEKESQKKCVCVGGYRRGAKGRGSIVKAPKPLNVFCQGIKDQLTAAATYQQSERECKSALMQMSLVFRGKTDCLYANTLKHNTLLCAIRSPWLPSSPVLNPTHSNTSRRQPCAEREEATTTSSHLTANRGQRGWQLERTNTLLRKINALTYLSWHRRVNTDSLKLLFTLLHTVGNGWGPGANVTTLQEREREHVRVKSSIHFILLFLSWK